MNEDLNVSSPNQAEIITNFYVDPQGGNDNNIGILNYPFKTLKAAYLKASKVNNGEDGVNINLLQGDYSSQTEQIHILQNNILRIKGNNQTIPCMLHTIWGGRVFVYDLSFSGLTSTTNGFFVGTNITINGISARPISANGAQVLLEGTLTINGSYEDILSAWDCAKIHLNVTSYTGNATGKKYRVYYNSELWNVKGIALIGSVNGETGNGGVYR